MERLFEDDKLSIAVSREGADNIERAYAAFGWHTERKYPDVRRIGMVCYELVRPHKIAQKDRLQLLQVRFEVAVNYLAKVNNRIPLRATIVGVILSLIAVALAIYGAFVVALSTTLLFGVVGTFIIFGGLFFGVLAAITAAKVLSVDQKKYSSLVISLQRNMQVILSEAAAITEGGDEH